MEFVIKTTWDSRPVNHAPIKLSLSSTDGQEAFLNISAPFFNDPPNPGGTPGKPFNKLWEYEVVEAFFLGKDEKYLELEFSPHGQHLVLLLSGSRNAIRMCLPLAYEAKVEGTHWYGTAKIPAAYFPPGVCLFNAYAIHGSADRRTYEALYPVPMGHFESPNFHRLEFFQPIDFAKIISLNARSTYSDVWKEALQKSGEPLTC